jgi:NAD(P)-dependent dehydrogenase (short-subunit alcohol dehydrogenase family)
MIQGVDTPKVVLITGCSTGIGRDLAQQLTETGYSVVATARNVESMDGLDVLLKLPLDVTRPESVHDAVSRIIARFGKIDILVNNAGYSQVGAIEELSDTQIQQMYDVNVFGVMRMIREVAPYMRNQKAGRIINISSIAGKLPTPVNGPYSSTKFALEALSDALRWELEPFNIRVIVVEPGAIKTNFDQTVHTFGDKVTNNPRSPYLPLYLKYQQVSEGMRGNEPGPEAVSKVVQQAIESVKPKTHYLAGVALPTRLVMALRDLVWDVAVRQLFKITPQV